MIINHDVGVLSRVAHLGGISLALVLVDGEHVDLEAAELGGHHRLDGPVEFLGVERERLRRAMQRRRGEEEKKKQKNNALETETRKKQIKSLFATDLFTSGGVV